MSVVLLSLTCWRSPATAQPTANKPIRVIDFLNASTGLVSYRDSTGFTYKFTRDGEIFIPPIKQVSQFAIQDSDVAWATIGNMLLRGDKAWTRWTFVDSEYAHTFIGCANGQLFLASNGSLYSATASGMNADTGILEGDQLRTLDYLSNKRLYIFTNRALYESTDGGTRWNIKFGVSGEGIFADRVHQLLYIGSPLRVSRDFGKTWTEMPDESLYPFIPLQGRVIGSHDCTGSFYVTPKGNITDTYRYGVDGFFHAVGTQPLTGTTRVFDGGAIVYDVGSSSSPYYSFTGIDGSLTDSAASQLVATSDTIDADLCGSNVDSLHISIQSQTCLPVAIDSVLLLKATGSLGKTAVHRILAGDRTTISVAYHAAVPGTDTVRMKLKVHSLEGRGYNEYLSVQSLVHVRAEPGQLSVPRAVDCGSAHLDSTRSVKFGIRNTGCAELRIDSVVSSRPALFSVSFPMLPLSIRSGDSLAISVHYTPQTGGEDLESIEIGSSGGHRFVTVTGKGISNLEVEDPAEDVGRIQFNGRQLRVQTPTSGVVELLDLLGITRREWRVDAGDHTLEIESLPVGTYIVRAPGQHAHKIQILP